MRSDGWVSPAIVAKYRATPQFIKEAFKIIKPDPERERECEYQLIAVLSGIEEAARMDKFKSVPTAAQYKKNLLKLAKTLQDAIELAAKAIPRNTTPNYGEAKIHGSEKN
jgi:hypothetical protein